MDIFLQLLLKMSGLYLCVGMGFLAVRKLGAESTTLSKLLFYLIGPLVFLYGVSQTPLSGKVLLLPLVVYAVCCLLGLAGYGVARHLWRQDGDRTANILGFTSGSGNMGYFGIPVALMIFDEASVALYILMVIGAVFYEATLGYAIATHGHYHWRDALRKISRMPLLHGTLIGLLLAWWQLPLPTFSEDFFLGIRSSYSILGMMLIGMGLAQLDHLIPDKKFLAFIFVTKFVIWPLLIGLLIWLDQSFFHLYGATIHDALMLISLAPLAVMSVILATLYNAHPEKMATAVFLSTCFALVYVPLMVSLLGLGG